MQTTPYDEHLRDSAPDNSRFDGFDRGDSGRNEDPGYEDIEATPRKPRKPSVAMRMLASLGWLGSPGGPLMPPLQMPTAIVPVHTCSSERRARRKLCRELGRRQYRRQTRRAYSLRDSRAVG